MLGIRSHLPDSSAMMERVKNMQIQTAPAAVVDAASKYVPEPVKEKSAMLAKAVSDSYSNLVEKSEPYRARATSYHEKQPVIAAWLAFTGCSVGIVLFAFLAYVLARCGVRWDLPSWMDDGRQLRFSRSLL